MLTFDSKNHPLNLKTKIKTPYGTLRYKLKTFCFTPRFPKGFIPGYLDGEVVLTPLHVTATRANSGAWLSSSITEPEMGPNPVLLDSPTLELIHSQIKIRVKFSIDYILENKHLDSEEG